MYLVKTNGETPPIGLGTRLKQKCDEFKPASYKTIIAVEKSISEAKSIKELITLMEFLSSENYAIASSTGYAVHPGVLSGYLKHLDSGAKSLPDKVLFMWNLIPRSMGLRVKVMQLSDCDEALIKRFT